MPLSFPHPPANGDGTVVGRAVVVGVVAGLGVLVGLVPVVLVAVTVKV